MISYKMLALGTALYLVIGAIIAFGFAAHDIVKNDYDNRNDYWCFILAWPLVIIYAVCVAPFWLFKRLLDLLNDAVNRRNKDGET